MQINLQVPLFDLITLRATLVSPSALALLVIPARFERATHSLEGCCSIQLSYGTKPLIGNPSSTNPLSNRPENRKRCKNNKNLCNYILFADKKCLKYLRCLNVILSAAKDLKYRLDRHRFFAPLRMTLFRDLRVLKDLIVGYAVRYLKNSPRHSALLPQQSSARTTISCFSPTVGSGRSNRCSTVSFIGA